MHFLTMIALLYTSASFSSSAATKQFQNFDNSKSEFLLLIETKS